MSWTPPPGTIGLTTSYGFTHVCAVLGQMLVGETTQYTHAFVVLDGGQVMEPWPGGARVSGIGDFRDDYVAYGWPLAASGDERQALAAAALSLDGIGYSVADYLALMAVRMGFNRALKRVARADRLLPAQFVMEVYRRAGVPLLDRIDVTLEDLGALFLTSDRWELRIPAADYA